MSYRTVTVVNPEMLKGGLSQAQDLAERYIDIDELANAAKGLRKLYQTARRRRAAETIVTIAHQEPRGDIDRFYDDMSTGLLEPLSSATGHERNLLARIMSTDLLLGNFEVAESSKMHPPQQTPTV